MALRIGINGFGRIGRLVFRIGRKNPDFDFVAVNDITNAENLAYLLKYDSTHGVLEEDVRIDNNDLIVTGDRFKVLSIKNPKDIPWKDLGVDIIIEAVGIFRSREKAAMHLEAGAKKVILTAPGKGEPPDFTCVLGINEEQYNPEKHHVISNASCTTNCFAPMVKLLNDNYGLQRGFMTTVHAYTNDQRLIDTPHKAMRRGRAAAHSIIPTTTGAAKAIEIVMPELTGKLDAIAIRVPVINGSLVDFVCILEKNATVVDINEKFKKASEEKFKGLIEYSDAPLVSVDVIGNTHSLIFDSLETKILKNNFIKLLGWYDNEWGYASRIVDLIKYVGEKL
ncbi:MAG: type I glyceraldehyde-3-phosphate dehydrogenase [Candidatus Cloacimonadota bacterium]|nr:MAG: type I glyceraldehyde-3-phosphate dehydrogenase [Candidatus Cloacimonadota bacterium]